MTLCEIPGLYVTHDAFDSFLGNLRRREILFATAAVSGAGTKTIKSIIFEQEVRSKIVVEFAPFLISVAR